MNDHDYDNNYKWSYESQIKKKVRQIQTGKIGTAANLPTGKFHLFIFM